MSREAITIMIIYRGWQLWQAEAVALIENESWSCRSDWPGPYEWDSYLAGVTPAGYVEEIRNGVWV